jgi:hypothetical protein
MARQTELLNLLVQAQQNQQRQQFRGGRDDHNPSVANYQDFISTQPPFFRKAEEPLDADAWLHIIESKFALLTIPCADSSKASFAAQQLRGAARIWWDNFYAMQPAGHVITSAEFRAAFRAHYIPEGLLERKLNEFLALTQGTSTVLQYAQNFNYLCQYAGYHADNDAKKQDRFRRGLNTKLKERLNLVKANTFSELVNIALTQEDCIIAHHAEKKRKTPTGPSSAQSPRYRVVPNTPFRAPQRNAPTGNWFSGRPNSREGIDLLFPRNNHNHLAHGQMFNKCHREAAIIAVSIEEARIISSEIVRGPRNLIKGRALLRVTKTRARNW